MDTNIYPGDGCAEKKEKKYQAWLEGRGEGHRRGCLTERLGGSPLLISVVFKDHTKG